MNDEKVLETIRLELHAIRRVVDELVSLKTDLGDREPNLRERAAAGAFLSQFYMGVESILKRILQYYGVTLPDSGTWHVDLFERFCEPKRPPVPLIFQGELEPAMDAFRRFRHIVLHGYGFQLVWNRMRTGIDQIQHVANLFEYVVSQFFELPGNE